MAKSSQLPRSSKLELVITPGDPAGVGPELTLRALARWAPKRGKRVGTITVVGAFAPLRRQGWAPLVTRLRKHGITLHHIDAPTRLSPGAQAGWSIERAVACVLSREHQGASIALVTGPIHKQRLQAGGYPYRGHTDFLEVLCARAIGQRRAPKPRALMMLANSRMRVALVTDHLPLARVARALTRASIEYAIDTLISALEQDFGVARPRVVVLGLNPHAGEGGRLGREELRVVAPAVARCARRWGERAEISGPVSADGYFGHWGALTTRDRPDAILALYHDQGLIPLKLTGFGRSVNLTLGLPIVRTSVDHGTAFELVGTGKASSSSFEAALEMAYRVLARRRSGRPPGGRVRRA